MNIVLIALLALCLNCIHGLTFSKPTRTAKVIKEELLSLSRKVNRGVSERLEDRQQIMALFEELEERNPVKVTLTNPLLNGVWELEYSTSEGTIGKKGPKKVGKILQTIDVKEGRVQNDDAVQAFGFLTVPRKAVAAITGVEPPQRAYVEFKRFFVGGIPIPVPPQGAKAFLDVTYVDEEVRLARGNRGSIFVLSRHASLPSKL